eukprot:CAMPEP_0176022842 /NCGR_PEP_ID=MMETSP0120_2-20121206/11130_1 /TAXON_ID=160619 /ORGANISM="Kryptoperidinium foliaceum, Strain CCMP 1326" /LENGTH=69 /DNA_ID=CAMNT_0017355993 /DNA_START=97 /DNA_END=306 /DNA_ORIENTATION=+
MKRVTRSARLRGAERRGDLHRCERVSVLFLAKSDLLRRRGDALKKLHGRLASFLRGASSAQTPAGFIVL